MISRDVVLRFRVILLTLAEHLAETRGVDRHDIESCRRAISLATAAYDQNVGAAALAAALNDELDLVDKARPGLPLR